MVECRLARPRSHAPRSSLFLIAWTGMRGIVTLAAALALPVTTAAGAPFPFRTEIILISFIVILATLVVQGLSLPPFIRLLRLQADHGLEQEESLAREHAATAALSRLDQLIGEEGIPEDQVERLRHQYTRRLEGLSRIGASRAAGAGDSNEVFQRLHHEVLTAERMALIALRNDGTISDDILHHLEQELDVAAMHLGVGERRGDHPPTSRR